LQDEHFRVSNKIMADDDNLYPFELIMQATPLSLQSKDNKRRAAWKDFVSEAARVRQNEVAPMVFLDERPLGATIFYFAPAPMEGDIDNIVKPILDAMNKIIYPDDRLIERVIVQKFEPGVPRAFEALSEQLAIALDTAPPVVYLRIDDDLDWRTVA